MSFINIQNIWNIEHALSIAGRILYLCQHFELTCKSLLSQLLSLEPTKTDGYYLQTILNSPDEFKREFKRIHDEYQKARTKNMELFLGDLRSEAKKKLEDKLTKNTLDLIGEAIKSRNYVCHDLLQKMIRDVGSSSHFYEFQQRNSYSTKSTALIEYWNQGSPRYTLKYKFDNTILLKHIRNISIGDYHVTKIEHEIEEDEPFPLNESEYIKKIETFVLKGAQILCWLGGRT
jgi:hypothetical protein